MSSVLNIMSTFYFALFFGASTNAGRIGLGSSLVDAGSKWYFVMIDFVISSLFSALIFFFIFNLIKKLFKRSSSSRS